MEIRFAQSKDIPSLIDLLKQVAAIHHEGRPDLFRNGAQKYSAEQLQEMLQQENMPIFVAAIDDRVCGYAFCTYMVTANHPVMHDHKTLYVEDLCVDEKMRRRGIGSKLFREVKAYGKALQFDSMTLNVWSFNHAAMKFYQSMGMKPQKTMMEAIL